MLAHAMKCFHSDGLPLSGIARSKYFLTKRLLLQVTRYLYSDLYIVALRAKEWNMGNRTFTIIKPDAFADGYAGAILDRIIKDGFKIVALKLAWLSQEKAGEFYAVHKERSFYGELTEFMSSGAILAAILEKENAVSDFRKLIGATNPANAEPGTLRKLFARSVGENAIHGSDSDENALVESDFFFSHLERL
jgi:nucleoside-diphosphate kinase